MGTGKNLFLLSKTVTVLSPWLDLGLRLNFTTYTVGSEWPWVTGNLLCPHISAQGTLLTLWLKKQPQASNRCTPSGHTDPTDLHLRSVSCFYMAAWIWHFLNVLRPLHPELWGLSHVGGTGLGQWGPDLQTLECSPTTLPKVTPTPRNPIVMSAFIFFIAWVTFWNYLLAWFVYLFIVCLPSKIYHKNRNLVPTPNTV